MTTPVRSGDAHMASGWIMLLYVEREREDWHSHWRCVAYAQLPLPSDENDGLAPSMYWDGMCSFVDDASLGDVSGTVTVTQNTSFGLAQEGTAGCEMRVSWTPLASMDGGLDAGRPGAVLGAVRCSPPANARRSRQLTDEPRPQTQPARGGVPDATDTRCQGFREVCDPSGRGGLGRWPPTRNAPPDCRYGHEDWLVQFKREGAGIAAASTPSP